MRFHKLPIIFKIFTKQFTGRKVIGASAFAGTTIQTIFNFFHTVLPLLSGKALPRCTAKKKRHAGCIVDGNFGGTGETITAATAKITRKLLSHLVNAVKKRLVQLRRIGFQ